MPVGHGIKDTTNWLRITAANGTTIPYLGYLELDVTYLGRVFPKMAILVSKDLPETAADSTHTYREQVPGVIGNNILQHVHDYLRTEQGSKDKAQGGQWSTWATACSFYGKSADPAFTQSGYDGRIGFVKMTRRKPVRVPAGSIKTVQGTANALGRST